MSTDEITGPWRRPVNDAADRAGSIHDDATARRAGFRGGTVAGSIHLDQFVPVLLDAFGRDWFETGSVSLYFRNATVDREAVRVACERPSGADGAASSVRTWMKTEEGALVAEGSAAVGADAAPTALAVRDLRAGDPSELKLLRLRPGDRFESRMPIDGTRQQARIRSATLTEPIDWYDGPSPWGGAVASPQTVIDLFSAAGVAGFGDRLGDAVAMYGALEVRHHRGPLLLGAEYDLEGKVVAVGQSPQTEYFWWDGTASDDRGPVATMRMMSRALKAGQTSPAGGGRVG